MKYIMFQRRLSDMVEQKVPVIFPDFLVHSEVAKTLTHMLDMRGAMPVSAGSIEVGGEYRCFGESETLNLKAHEGDSFTMNTYRYLNGISDEAMKVEIEVMYSCPECGLKDTPVKVPERGEEDVVQWMEQVGTYISADHRKRSPNCHPETLHEVKIPITGADKIGGAPKQ